MSVIIWDVNNGAHPVVNQFGHHTEFVVGLDFNIFVEKQIATTSWDKKTSIFNYDENPMLVA